MSAVFGLGGANRDRSIGGIESGLMESRWAEQQPVARSLRRSTTPTRNVRVLSRASPLGRGRNAGDYDETDMAISQGRRLAMEPTA